MKIFAAAILSAVLFAAPIGVIHRDSVIDRAHRTTHSTEEETIFGSSRCSATSIGPHALLTASHCEMATKEIEIDGNDAKILDIERDGNDHTIYFVDVTFPEWANVSSDEPQMGDNVFIIGNPGKNVDVLRKGYVASVRKPSSFADILNPNAPKMIWIDLNGYRGDSGAAVFNEKGEIIAVISAAHFERDSENDPWFEMKIMISISLNFTPDQLKRATSDDPKADLK